MKKKKEQISCGKHACFWLLYKTDVLLFFSLFASQPKKEKRHSCCQLVSKDEMNIWVGLNLRNRRETPCNSQSILGGK